MIDERILIALNEYQIEMGQELFSILDYWLKHTIDNGFGGFYGNINNENKIDKTALKGSVLNSRILWAFSCAYNLTNNNNYLQAALRAFTYIKEKFIDKQYGGVYWSVDYKGNKLDTKKQVYALSFAIYGLSEFFIASKNEEAIQFAIELYRLIIVHSYDNINGGYIEALTEDWADINDLRLSEKDANEKKSMNTHLHVLEGFANLYRVWPDEALKQRIKALINNFSDHIIDKKNNHLILFFDEKWNAKSSIISYGHDAEAAWLIQEAAEIIYDNNFIEKIKLLSVVLANAAAKGLDKDGGLWYEVENDHLIKEKHWWPQAEAMIGFFNAWQITGDESYLKKSLANWNFTKQFILDKKNGEWFWGVKENYDIMNEDKVGLWKCPYHNSRACIEIIRRINDIRLLG